MRLRCRFGIHEWAHLGYQVAYFVRNGEKRNCYKTHRYCTACGKRWSSKTEEGIPPDVDSFRDGSYIDHSRPKETR